ncbi:unnamed protein product [Symbiodinium sp. CCMP2592]|nr:unnamed protein product [Symbiodinium sp. CCMP2592]
MCVLHKAMGGGAEWELCLMARRVFTFLPIAALGLWVVLSMQLAARSPEGLGSLWSAAADAELLQAVEARAKVLRRQMHRGRLKPTAKDRLTLHMEFLLFMADYITDWNNLAQLVLGEEYWLAAAQACIIVVPVLLDCYRGKIQLVEAFAGFAKSRKKGFPSNGFLKALCSEKSTEAPLSLMLQYYSFLRVTRRWGFWSAVLSMALSLLSITKFAYATFELCATDAAAERISNDGDEDARSNPDTEPPQPLQMNMQVAPPAKFPVLPPGMLLPTDPVPMQCGKGQLPFDAVAPPHSCPLPIKVDHDKIADTE